MEEGANPARTSGFSRPSQWVSDTEAVHLRGRKSIRSEQGFYTRSAPGLRFAPDTKQMVQLVHWPHYSQKPHYSYKGPYSQKPILPKAQYSHKIPMANGIYQSILAISQQTEKACTNIVIQAEIYGCRLSCVVISSDGRR